MKGIIAALALTAMFCRCDAQCLLFNGTCHGTLLRGLATEKLPFLCEKNGLLDAVNCTRDVVFGCRGKFPDKFLDEFFDAQTAETNILKACEKENVLKIKSDCFNDKYDDAMECVTRGPQADFIEFLTPRRPVNASNLDGVLPQICRYWGGISNCFDQNFGKCGSDVGKLTSDMMIAFAGTTCRACAVHATTLLFIFSLLCGFTFR